MWIMEFCQSSVKDEVQKSRSFTLLDFCGEYLDFEELFMVEI